MKKIILPIFAILSIAVLCAGCGNQSTPEKCFKSFVKTVRANNGQHAKTQKYIFNSDNVFPGWSKADHQYFINGIEYRDDRACMNMYVISDGVYALGYRVLFRKVKNKWYMDVLDERRQAWSVPDKVDVNDKEVFEKQVKPNLI